MDRRTSYAFYLLFFLLISPIVVNTGCGGTAPPNCGLALGLAVAPPSITLDHLAAPPGNSVTFVGADTVPKGCIPPPGPIRLDLHWTVSDTANVTIGNTKNVDYGLATCVHATPVPATVTATGTNSRGDTISGTATLTCN